MTIQALGHPLSMLLDGGTGFSGGAPHPLPLVSCRFDVTVQAGLAVVTTSRTFRNGEEVAIEAVMTFPVDVNSVVTGLAVMVDGRRLEGMARSKSEARRAYEDAIDEGRLAVLHEEALKGLHVLSVAQLGPGQQVEVIVETVAPVGLSDGGPTLRIPTTVGDVYGTSPLGPADALVTGDHALKTATLSVSGDVETASVDGVGLLLGDMPVRLDRAIIIRFPALRLGERAGRDAGGRSVNLVLSPAAAHDGALDCAVLFDRSGSTDNGLSNGSTIWQAMTRGLRTALAGLGRADRVQLWQFDSECQLVGEGAGAGTAKLVARLGEPAGGTELGTAIDCLAQSGVRDILVLTDGETHANEIQDAATKPCRVSAVLVGPDSLDAGIGQLVSMSGGQLAWSAGDQVATAIATALAGMRTPGAAVSGTMNDAVPVTAVRTSGGVEVRASWSGPSSAEPAASGSDAVGRYAAALAIPLFERDAAADWATRHQLCTHLTSLVLVDREGAVQSGLPEMRKVGLAEASLMDASVSLCAAPPSDFVEPPNAFRFTPYEIEPSSIPELVLPYRSTLSAPRIANGPASPSWFAQLDFAGLGSAWERGDLSGIPDTVRSALAELVSHPDLLALSAALRRDPLLVAIALCALDRGGGRHAARLARSVLKGAPADLLEAAQLAITVKVERRISSSTSMP